MCTTLQWKRLETMISMESIYIVGLRSDGQLIKVRAQFSYNENPLDISVKVQNMIKELESHRNPREASISVNQTKEGEQPNVS